MTAKWVRKTLGEITTKIGSGATPLGGEDAYKTSGISLIRSLNVYDDGFRERKLARIDEEQASRLSNVVVEVGDVLLNITGASVARCCLAPVEFIPARVNQHVSIIRPIKQKIDSAFFQYLLISKTYKDRLLHTGEEGGSTRQAITKAQLQNFSIEYPESLPEQQRIVTLLDEAFDGIATAKANAERNLQNGRAIFESHLQSVFTMCGRGWSKRKLKEICDKITDGTHQTPTYFQEGTVFLSSRNVTSGKIDWEKIKYIDEVQHLQMHKRVAPRMGDILLAKNGTTGVAAMVDRDVVFDIYVSLALLRAREEILPDLLLYFVNSPVAKVQFNKRLKGSGVPNLHLEEIREVEISFPTSIDEQSTLVSSLDSVSSETQRLESLYQRKLTALDELKKSLLDQAFSGQL